MEKFLSIPVTGHGNQLISATNILFIKQASYAKTAIRYKDGGVVEITHAAVSNDDFRDFLQENLIAALQTSWATPVLLTDPPVAVSVIYLKL
jgi:hypothetical protein